MTEVVSTPRLLKGSSTLSAHTQRTGSTTRFNEDLEPSPDHASAAKSKVKSPNMNQSSHSQQQQQQHNGGSNIKASHRTEKVKAARPRNSDVNIVKSGQTYKQMFDAGVQLSQAYDAAEHKRSIRKFPDIRQVTGGIPLVDSGREAAIQSTGILTQSQQDWVETLPFDDKVENPVLTKFRSQIKQKGSLVGEQSSLGKEVRDLPDEVVAAGDPSGIIDRIDRSKHERHARTVDELRQMLFTVSMDLEPKIVGVCEEIREAVFQGEEDMNNLMTRFGKGPELLSYSLSEMKTMWLDIEKRTAEITAVVEEGDLKLQSFEEERVDKVADIVKQYCLKLYDVAYLPVPDIEKFVDDECQLVNQVVLSNRRAYSDLYMRLMTRAIEKEKGLHNVFNVRVDEWREYRLDAALQEFSDFMKSSEVTDPPKVGKTIEKVKPRLRAINQKRIDLLDSLVDFIPPASTKKAIYEWTDKVTVLSEELDKECRSFMEGVFKSYEEVCLLCADRMKLTKNHLVTSDVVSGEEFDQIASDELIPLIQAQQKLYEEAMETLERGWEAQNDAVETELKEVFTFCQGAAHLWDIHEVGLTHTERALQERLQLARKDHDIENQDRENNLDLVMDRLRQEATEDGLRRNLKRVKDHLEQIRDMYADFHSLQLEVVQTYPLMVEGELADFDTAVCTYFGVDKSMPQDSTAALTRDEKAGSRTIPPQSGLAASTGSHKEGLSRTTSAAGRSNVTSPISDGPKTPLNRYRLADLNVCPLPGAVGEVLQTARGLRYYVVVVAMDNKDGGEEEDTLRSGGHGAADTALSGTGERKDSYVAVASYTPSEVKGQRVEVKELGFSHGETIQVTSAQGEWWTGSIGSRSGVFPADRVKKAPSTKSLGGAFFMTEAPDRLQASQCGTNSHTQGFLATFNIQSARMVDIKKMVRMSFLSYLEMWTEQANQRSHSVVAAKCEELDSELDLRYHLHEPRSKRSELDVHNVRAAELVMHHERVARHCKGIGQSLIELRKSFDSLIKEHNKFFDRYQGDVKAMESVIVRATKSSMLVELQGRLHQMKERFMEEIRTSLRHFRKKLDGTLQMLRESNAKLIQSFKLFSDGGNFAPDEIDEFRKKLERHSHKIDDSEGHVMSELEGMEAKWLRRATTLSNEFEDRFRNHMVDLVFMEKVARWLTNTQVKVKSEVADSNARARDLMKFLDGLDRRIDACERPNLDKEQVHSSDLYGGLIPIYTAFHERSAYIACRLDKDSGASEEGPAKPQARVAFNNAIDTALTTVTVMSLPKAKSTMEDPTVSLIKNIYKTQKPKPAAVPAPDPVPGPTTGEDFTAGKTDHSTTAGGQGETREKLDTGALSSRAAKASTTAVPPPPKSPSRSRQSHRSTNTADSRSQNRHSSAARKSSRFDRKDKRFVLFPDENASEDSYFDNMPAHFLGKMKRIVKEAHEGLLAAAEMYYKQKGTRSVTRPYALQETLEQCAETVTQKLYSYFKQADDYHNNCLQEFRDQLVRLETLAARVPSLVLKDTAAEERERAAEEEGATQDRFNKVLGALDRQRFEHQILLRPTLGHPNLTHKMDALVKSETQRGKVNLEEIDQLEDSLKSLAQRQAAVFVQSLAAAAQRLLTDGDQLLTVDDVEKGRIPPNKYGANELIRRKERDVPLEDEVKETIMPRGKRSWEGLVTNELLTTEAAAAGTTTAVMTTATVETQKTTMVHYATQKAVKKIYEGYKRDFFQKVKAIEENKTERVISETRWASNWDTSVAKISSLYD